MYVRPHSTWTTTCYRIDSLRQGIACPAWRCRRARSSEPQAKDVPSRRLCGSKFDPHGSLARSDLPDQTARLTGP